MGKTFKDRKDRGRQSSDFRRNDRDGHQPRRQDTENNEYPTYRYPVYDNVDRMTEGIRVAR